MPRLTAIILVALAAIVASPTTSGARPVSLDQARRVLRASGLTTPIWFTPALPPPYRGRPVTLTIGPGDLYLARVVARPDPNGRRSTLTFGRARVYLVDARAFCLARGGHWRVWIRTRRRFSSCTEDGARTVFFVRSDRLYDVSVDAAATIGYRALRHAAARFAPL